MSQSSWLVAGMLPGIERQQCKKLEPNPERLLALLQRRDSETGSGARDPCGAPLNAGVQGGTESSNLLCSSGESANSRSRRDQRYLSKSAPWVPLRRSSAPALLAA